MKDKLIKIGSVAVLVGICLFPILALAQTQPNIDPVNPPDNDPIVDGPQGIVDWLNTILEYIGIIFWIVAVGFILYAGFLYLTAAGDPEKVKKATAQLKFGIIGIVVGLIAYGLPKLIESILRS